MEFLHILSILLRLPGLPASLKTPGTRRNESTLDVAIEQISRRLSACPQFSQGPPSGWVKGRRKSPQTSQFRKSPNVFGGIDLMWNFIIFMDLLCFA